MKRATYLFVAVALASACEKKEEAAIPLPAEDDPDKEDYQAKRVIDPEDQIAPTALVSFAVGTGPRLGEVEILFSFPEIHDYKSIEIRRALGNTAPADCNTGDVVTTLETFEDASVIDAGLFPGAYYSYTACISDAAENVTVQQSANSARASDYQRIFVTSTVYDANLNADFNSQSFQSGLEGADARCQWHADQASLGGTWKALLSSETLSAKTRIPMYSSLHNIAGEKLGSGVSDIWDGELLNSVMYTETGTAISDDWVWTGSDSGGNLRPNNTCSNWTTTASTGDGALGKSDASPNDPYPYQWISYGYVDCTASAALYCVESDSVSFEEPTVSVATTATTGTLEASVSFGSTENVSYIKLVRQAGKNFKNDDCRIDSSYRSPLRSDVVKVYNGSEAYPYESDSVSDAIDLDNSSGFTNEQGWYHYYACVYDMYGNVRAIGNSPGIQDGSGFLRTFIADNAFDGLTLSIAAANTECTNSATAAGLAGTFKALVSDSSNDASGNLGTTNFKYIYDLDGNYAGRISSGPSYSLLGFAPTTTANGTAVASGAYVWTGSFYNATHAMSCNDWASNNSNDIGAAGRISERPDLSDGWPYWSYADCDNSYKIVCIEDNN
ncbi:MAG: hypothetical protein AB7T49_03850 [Oligoflexales bacterium]